MPVDLSMNDEDDDALSDILSQRPTLGQRIRGGVHDFTHRDLTGDGRVRRRVFRRASDRTGIGENDLLGMAWDRTITNIDLPEYANRARAARAMWMLLRSTAKHFGDSTKVAVAAAKWAEGIDLSEQFLDALEEVVEEEDADEAVTGIDVSGFMDLLGYGEDAQDETEIAAPPLGDVPATEVSEAEAKSWATRAYEAGQAKFAETRKYVGDKFAEGQKYIEDNIEAGKKKLDDIQKAVEDEIDEAKKRVDDAADAAKMLGFGLAAVAAALLLSSGRR